MSGETEQPQKSRSKRSSSASKASITSEDIALMKDEDKKQAAIRHLRDRRFSPDGTAPKMTQEQRERKRLINRLSAQRKRQRERYQLDTLTDQYSKYTALNGALSADNERLEALQSKMKSLLESANCQAKASGAGTLSNLSIMTKVEMLEILRDAMVECIESSETSKVISAPVFDPVLDSAGGIPPDAAPKTPENSPFNSTTSFLKDKLKILDMSKQIILQNAVSQSQPPSAQQEPPAPQEPQASPVAPPPTTSSNKPAQPTGAAAGAMPQPQVQQPVAQTNAPLVGMVNMNQQLNPAIVALLGAQAPAVSSANSVVQHQPPPAVLSGSNVPVSSGGLEEVLQALQQPAAVQQPALQVTNVAAAPAPIIMDPNVLSLLLQQQQQQAMFPQQPPPLMQPFVPVPTAPAPPAPVPAAPVPTLTTDNSTFTLLSQQIPQQPQQGPQPPQAPLSQPVAQPQQPPPVNDLLEAFLRGSAQPNKASASS